jgi:hypothetical protein
LTWPSNTLLAAIAWRNRPRGLAIWKRPAAPIGKWLAQPQRGALDSSSR